MATPDDLKAKAKRLRDLARQADQAAGGAYDDHRADSAARSRAKSAEGRDVGPLPAVADPGHRNACLDDLRLFCETYLCGRFTLAWSDDHLRCIDKLQTAVIDGGQFAFAMPRGSGKTSLCVAAALWCALYGHRAFVVLIGATDPAAVELLDSLKVEVETNPLLGADFPEVCHPVRELKGIHNRAGGQTLAGERTRIEWTDSQVTLPTVAGAPSSGAVVRALGITGRIRGMSHTTAAGRTIRPDLVVLDDPQTDESAASPTQNVKREAIVSRAVLGLAGPKVKIAAVMPCTVIAPDDMADKILDPDLHPEWKGERTKLLYAEPAAADLWERYAEFRRESLRAGEGIARATEFYRANREAMDVGARVAWPERFNPDELSAVQFAMNLKLADYRAFMAEYQNEPDRGTFGTGAKELLASSLAGRLSGTERHVVPRECTRLTAGFDCGKSLLWYLVTAWTEGGGGTVIDYGCWPRQSRAVFAADDARPALADVHRRPDGGEMTESQLVFAGLKDVVAEVLGREYRGEGGGEVVRVEKALVDSGWQTAVVYQFVRQCPHAGILLPSKGIGRTLTSRGVGEWKPRKGSGERLGYHWRLGVSESGRGRSVQFDPDPWKTLLWERLTTPPGAGTALTLFGKSAGTHAMLSEHLAAEYSVPATLRGQTFDKWAVRPDRPDNHLLDALVMSAVAASVLGLKLEAATETGRPVEAPRAPARRMSEVLAAKREGRAAAGGGAARVKLSEVLAQKRRGRR